MKEKGDLTAIIAIFLFYLVLFALGITCPIKFLTGISCPGCGMTRSWLSLLGLDFSSAIYYHPLFWTVPILLYLIKDISSGKNSKLLKILLTIILILFIIVYFYRLIVCDSTIVVFEPNNGFIYGLFTN